MITVKDWVKIGLISFSIGSIIFFSAYLLDLEQSYALILVFALYGLYASIQSWIKFKKENKKE